MIIEPKVREYICTTAHPQGCAESVRNQADYACKQGMVNGTKKGTDHWMFYRLRPRITNLRTGKLWCGHPWDYV